MLAGGRAIILRMRPRAKFGSSSLQGPNESAIDAKVRAVLAWIAIVLRWPAPYTASVAEVTGSGDTFSFLRSGDPVRHGIDVSSIAIELHRNRFRHGINRQSRDFTDILINCDPKSLNPGVAAYVQYDSLIGGQFVVAASRRQNAGNVRLYAKTR